MLEQVYESTQVLSTANLKRLIYVAGWDAFFLYQGSTGYRLFRDGTLKALSTLPASNFEVGSLLWGQPCLMPYSFGDSGWEIFAMDIITGLWNPTAPLNQGGHYPPVATSYFIDPEAGVYVGGSGQNIKGYDLTDGSELWSISTPGITWESFHYAGKNQVVALDIGGNVRLVDYALGEVLYTTAVDAFLLGAYDCFHRNVFIIRSDGKTRNYVWEPVPATLSAPVFDPVTVYRLRGNVLSCRLTGSEGEPCPNYKVLWELLGGPAKGQLEKPASNTDSDGYAYNYYFGPSAPGETGSEDVKVTVEL